MKNTIKPILFNQFNKKWSFSLIEVIITLALLASIITIVYVLYFNSFRQTTEGMDKIDIQKKLRNVIERLTSDFRSAKAIIRIEPSVIEFSKFIDDNEKHTNIDFNGNTKKIKYECIKKSYGQPNDLIIIEVDNVKEELMKFDFINENIFEAYTLSNQNLILFDYHVNDSIMRSMISLIKIKFEVKQGNTIINFNSSVNSRFIHGFQKQPFWNFVR